MGSKKKKKKRKKFHDDFLRSLSSNQRWPRVATLRFPTIDIQFTGQSKYPFHSPNRSTISRIPFGLRPRSLLDGRRRNGYGRIFTGVVGERVVRACRTRELHEGNWREHRNYCRRRCNNIQPIVSGRVAGTRDLLFARQDR